MKFSAILQSPVIFKGNKVCSLEYCCAFFFIFYGVWSFLSLVNQLVKKIHFV
jgi:hypothetical protein